ncbi:MAG: hypothetical protein JWN04_3882 [Myxococcaceae bacterium]|nr:hypothetical protein [Myxococcaceae bacterium]
MSTSIRPGGPVAPGIAGVDAPTDPSATSASGAVDQARATSAVAPAQVAEVDGSSAALLARLDGGLLTREQAIEGLVAQALETHGGAHLPPAQRAELEAVLRAAMLDDPALASLLG